VPEGTVDPIEAAACDDVLRECRQGDCFVGDRPFVQRALIDGEEHWVEESVLGLVLVSQTCDIVRSPEDRPSVTMCPLVEVDEAQYSLVAKGYMPRYAALPGVSARRLVADLDRSMTVDKTVMVRWERIAGVSNDIEGRAFALALSRKASRFAFPDDFNEYVAPLAKRLREKHDKQSPEGNALRALAEVRVMAEPHWDAPEVDLTFYFIREQDAVAEFDGKPWLVWAEKWMALLTNSARFKNPHPIVQDHATMIVAEYLQSDQLDLEHLSA
jgi:hypothetical protein